MQKRTDVLDNLRNKLIIENDLKNIDYGNSNIPAV